MFTFATKIKVEILLSLLVYVEKVSHDFYFSYLSELYFNFYLFDVRKTTGCTRGSQVFDYADHKTEKNL